MYIPHPVRLQQINFRFRGELYITETKEAEAKSSLSQHLSKKGKARLYLLQNEINFLGLEKHIQNPIKHLI